MNADSMLSLHTPTPAQKRRNELAAQLCPAVSSCNPKRDAHRSQPRHVADALMRANRAIREDAEDTAEQSWTVYFDLKNSGSYVLQDGELFREAPGGTYTPVGRVRKRSTN